MKKQNQDSKIDYVIYARKSSESEDKQMASIEDQLTEMRKIAEREKLSVVGEFTEARSAKEPGRPQFSEMMKKISKGEANGILCWKLNRLARNPIDGATVQWMLQQGVIQEVKTFGRSYCPNDNVIVIAVELGMANQYIRDLGVDTARGLRNKAERGYFPGQAPIGYVNSKLNSKVSNEENNIKPDPERFHLMKKAWHILHERKCSTQKLYKIIKDELGVRSPRGKPYGRSTIYNAFSNPIYCGDFMWGGKLYHGKHKPMVTRRMFEEVQEILGNRTQPQGKRHVFAFTGLMRCGECGCGITAEKKTKKQKNGNVHRYTYYHCTKRRGSCSQKCMREEKLEQQISNVLASIEIPTEFREWAFKVLREQNQVEASDNTSAIRQIQKEYDRCTRKIYNLIDMRAAGELTEEEFVERKEVLTKEKSRLEKKLKSAGNRTGSWLEKAGNFLSFAETARQTFETGGWETKRRILGELCSNLILTDNILKIQATKPLVAIKKAASEVKREYAMLEPRKNQANKEILEEIFSQNPVLLRG